MLHLHYNCVEKNALVGDSRFSRYFSAAPLQLQSVAVYINSWGKLSEHTHKHTCICLLYLLHLFPLSCFPCGHIVLRSVVTLESHKIQFAESVFVTRCQCSQILSECKHICIHPIACLITCKQTMEQRYLQHSSHFSRCTVFFQFIADSQHNSVPQFFFTTF